MQTINVVQAITQSVSQPPFAKLCDIAGRFESYGFAMYVLSVGLDSHCSSLYVLGYIIVATSPNIGAYAAGTIIYTLGITGFWLVRCAQYRLAEPAGQPDHHRRSVRQCQPSTLTSQDADANAAVLVHLAFHPRQHQRLRIRQCVAGRPLALMCRHRLVRSRELELALGLWHVHDHRASSCSTDLTC